jgi:hypothetical protein
LLASGKNHIETHPIKKALSPQKSPNHITYQLSKNGESYRFLGSAPVELPRRTFWFSGHQLHHRPIAGFARD